MSQDIDTELLDEYLAPIGKLQELTYEFWQEHRKLPKTFQSHSHVISVQDIQLRIEQVILELYQQLTASGSVTLSFISNLKSADFSTSHYVNCLSSLRPTTLSSKTREIQTIAHILKVLEISYTLLLNNTKATKREVFYMAAELFKTQRYSDKAIDCACSLLEIPRNRLNILSAGKGLVCGNISFNENGVRTEVGNRIMKIPFDTDTITDIETNSDFILVVEKDTALNRLFQENFFLSFNCIALTGCGYPDLLTREFLKRLVQEFSFLPVLVLTDFDPHGFKILCTYTFGSLKMSAECDSLAVPFAHWIGFFGEAPGGLPLSSGDRKLLLRMIEMPQLNLEKDSYQGKRFGIWREKLEEMLKNDCKFEIEEIGSLKEYLMVKVLEEGWI